MRNRSRGWRSASVARAQVVHATPVVRARNLGKVKKKRYNFNKTFDTFENVRISTLSKNDKPFESSLLYVITITCHHYCYDVCTIASSVLEYTYMASGGSSSNLVYNII